MPDMLIVAAAMPTLIVTLNRTLCTVSRIGHDLGLRHIGFRQQHRELLAAEPGSNDLGFTATAA
jgi:hypothetical protein